MSLKRRLLAYSLTCVSFNKYRVFPIVLPMDFMMGMIFCIIPQLGVPKNTILAFDIWISQEAAIVCFTFQDIFKIVLMVLFLLAIVLSVHLLFTGSDYPFGIFKLFLTCNVMNIW